MLPQPEQFPLSGEGLRGWLEHSYLPSVVHDYSGNKILDALKSFGAEIRRQDFFAIRRNVLEITAYQEAIETLRPDTPVPYAWYNDSHGWNMQSEFLYKFNATGFHPKTGEPITMGFHLGSNSILNKEEAMEQMSNLIMGLEEFYKITNYQLTMVSALAKPGALERAR